MTRARDLPYANPYMNIQIAVLSALLNSSLATALPNDFAGLKLGQNVEATKKFLLEKGHNIIYPDGKIVWAKGEKTFKPEDMQRTISVESKSGQLCTVTTEPLLPKTQMPAIQTFNCGIVKDKKTPVNNDRVIDTYIISHFIDEKNKTDKAFYLTYMFNTDTSRPAGSGLIGKLGEPDTETPAQTCPPFIRSGVKGKRSVHNCFVTIWLPDGSQAMATAVGFGQNLRTGKVARLEIWELDTQRKVEAHKATKAADDLGF